MTSPRSVKGMRDLLPPETAVWAAVEATARRVFGLYGFSEIRTPILEETELFVRSVGESTDIVGKEMYTFVDKGGRSVTLRPESTAPVARAFVEHNLRELHYPQRLFYIGPQFRYERPQKGRYRQFHQIGAEVFDEPHPAADVDLLLMLLRFLGELGFSGLAVRINTVGDRRSREAYAEALRGFLEQHRDALGEDSRRRLETNPLRILDTKVSAERELLSGAPALEESLSEQSARDFARVRDLLQARNVAHQVDPRLVRGLDYYSGTVFEISSDQLGAQDAIVGGGRYDELVAALGGPEASGLGFAIGEDRLIEILPASFRQAVSRSAPPPVTVIGMSTADRGGEDLRLAEELRGAGVSVVAELGVVKLKLALKRAERRGSRWVLLLGEDELRDGTVTVKDFESGEQQGVPRERIAGFFEERR
ncbi:MAG TPA: histidine--tRNA ligase [Thermoanaerobaculia bacterium]|nr:histidine--tRNA ligase [Thermoanaerobaculia bacterium]